MEQLFIFKILQWGVSAKNDTVVEDGLIFNGLYSETEIGGQFRMSSTGLLTGDWGEYTLVKCSVPWNAPMTNEIAFIPPCDNRSLAALILSAHWALLLNSRLSAMQIGKGTNTQIGKISMQIGMVTWLKSGPTDVTYKPCHDKDNMSSAYSTLSWLPRMLSWNGWAPITASLFICDICHSLSQHLPLLHMLVALSRVCPCHCA